ncbi:MAG: tetratricopeptide repeat protein [Cytophagaceae bacterium]|nr:MAG: tetratricopeptide repeat protein [Cytophagaceae bacterium]
MKLILPIALLCLWSCAALAQHSLSDSLRSRLDQPQADTSRVLLLDQLGRSLMYSKPILAMQYAQEGLGLAKTIGFRQGEARILNRIGTILRITGNYAKALEAHLASVQVATAIHDVDALARTYNNIGILYSERKDSRKAIEYFQKTLSLAAQLGNNDLKRISLTNIGTDYAFLNQLDSALLYTQKAYDLTRQLNATDSQIELINLGNIYKRLGKNTLALAYYRKSVPTSVTGENNRTLSQTYFEMAETFRQLNQPDSAIQYAKQSLQLAKATNIPLNTLNASKLLSELYEQTNPAQALMYYKTAAASKDSLESAEKDRTFQNIEFNEKQRLQDLEQQQQAYRSRITTYSLLGILAVFMLIAALLYRTNRQKQKANVLLQHQRDEINHQRNKVENTLAELKATQAQLIQKEKLASLGELTAGIAHEIQNPLNFVNNFSEITTELLDELKEDMRVGNMGDALATADELSQNLEKITHHGKRAGSIVRSMLEHSRVSTGDRQPTDLNALASEYLRLAYHGQRIKNKAFTAELLLQTDPDLPMLNIVPQDIGRVLQNLYTNAFYALQQRQTSDETGYEPTLWVSTQRLRDEVVVHIRDNGTGIPAKLVDKIFQPFFTTKPTGEGTGLGLSLSYDIVTKGHGGQMQVDTKEGEGTSFTLRFPISRT